MIAGIAFALAAGLLWGLVFVTPLMLADYPAILLSFGRYLAFGLIAVPLALADPALKRLRRADWQEALKLALIGNLLYYACLAAAIQLADAPLPTLLIGTLPLVIAVCSNWIAHRPLSWFRLLPSLLLIAAGIALVNQQEWVRMQAQATQHRASDYGWGTLLALGAVACWTWYPIRNARWLQHNPSLRSSTWATAQGIATLPPAALGMGLALLWFGVGPGQSSGFVMPLGERPLHFIGLMLTLGLLASWLGTLCWNAASQRLPTTLAGQLIVFETLAALAYAFLWRGEAPSWLAGVGIGLLMAGVAWGVHTFHHAASDGMHPPDPALPADSRSV